MKRRISAFTVGGLVLAGGVTILACAMIAYALMHGALGP